MNTEIELKLLKEIEELRKEVNLLKGKDENSNSHVPIQQNHEMLS
jgi:hypothetical protein